MAKQIDISDLSVYYGKFKAVEGVSMTVEPCSATAFIGPSGCGKSTFLRTLNRKHEVDKPCSALDPISTLAIEELVDTLKQRYTIVIVTHNMPQAARVSDQTAFFNLAATGQPGRLVEVESTQRIFNNPAERATEDYISGRFG